MPCINSLQGFVDVIESVFFKTGAQFAIRLEMTIIKVLTLVVESVLFWIFNK